MKYDSTEGYYKTERALYQDNACAVCGYTMDYKEQLCGMHWGCAIAILKKHVEELKKANEKKAMLRKEQ